MAEGHKLPRGSGSMPPRKFFFEMKYVLRCNLAHFETILIFFLGGGEAGHFGGGELLPLKYPR